MRTFREFEEQYRFSDRNFRINDRVVFVGPPRNEENPTIDAPAQQHKLFHKKGRIAYGPTESYRCYPNEPIDSELGRMVWVTFDKDSQPIRQVDCGWLVKTQDCFIPDKAP